eukprot:5555878-Amphidinium_carterae.1
MEIERLLGFGLWGAKTAALSPLGPPFCPGMEQIGPRIRENFPTREESHGLKGKPGGLHSIRYHEDTEVCTTNEYCYWFVEGSSGVA